MTPRWKKSIRRVIAGLIAVALGAAVATIGYHVSVQPGAAMVKAVFETGAEVKPAAGFAKTEAAVTEVSDVALKASGYAASTIDVYSPKATPSAPLPVILWIHGGGFISSSADTVRDYAIMLANEGYVVASLDYTLAPAARYPTPVAQGNAALAYLAANAATYGGDPSRIVLGGDSAGAQIAGDLAALQSNPQLATSVGLTPALADGQLKGVVLFCGLYDMTTVGSTGFPALRTYLWAYTGTRNYTDFADIDQLSVTKQVTADFPPTFITVGDIDPFEPQAKELTKVLAAKGVPVTSLFFTGSGDGLSHEYQFDFALAQANEAFTKTLAFLSSETGTGTP